MARAHRTPHRKSQPRRQMESVTRKQTHTCNNMMIGQRWRGLTRHLTEKVSHAAGRDLYKHKHIHKYLLCISALCPRAGGHCNARSAWARAHQRPHRKSQPRRRTESVTRKQTHTCNNMMIGQRWRGLTRHLTEKVSHAAGRDL